MSRPATPASAERAVTGVAGEAARKSVHVLLSLVAAAVVWWLPSTTAAVILAAAAAAALSVEALRLASDRFGGLFLARLAPMLRPREAARLTGATSLAIGYTAAAVLLPGTPALAGILYVGIGDALAAVIGRRWGRHRFPGGKSVEGSLVFLGVTLGITLALGASLPAAAGVALILTVLEAPSLPVDDNLFLPLAGAVVFRAVAGV